MKCLDNSRNYSGVTLHVWYVICEQRDLLDVQLDPIIGSNNWVQNLERVCRVLGLEECAVFLVWNSGLVKREADFRFGL